MHCAAPISAQACSSSWHGSSGTEDESPAPYRPPYDVTTYVCDFAACFDTARLSKRSNVGMVVVVLYGPGVPDTSVSAWRKKKKALERSRSFRFAGCLLQKRLVFVRCWENDAYQRQFVGLLAGVRRRPEEPTIVGMDPLVLPEHSG